MEWARKPLGHWQISYGLGKQQLGGQPGWGHLDMVWEGRGCLDLELSVCEPMSHGRSEAMDGVAEAAAAGVHTGSKVVMQDECTGQTEPAIWERAAPRHLHPD